MDIRPAIVVIAYNRPDALTRLLSSVESASYSYNIHPILVISIDKSDSDDVVTVAREFKYSHGEKIVIERPERMGLKDHVIACGDLTKEYGSIIVLEDDLFVAPGFYDYACAALRHTTDDAAIGGVSLYNHLFNVHVRESFQAFDDGYDNWYLQMASSWGQAYTADQWEGFKKWYADNADKDLKCPAVPSNISGWSDRSWLKYYIAYLIETGRYFIYPRVSMTTNFGDIGSHACKTDTDLQVPIGYAKRAKEYVFSTLDQSNAVYDAFFEPKGIMMDGEIRLGGISDKYEGEDKQELIVDLYGSKPLDEIITSSKEETCYVLTSRSLPYKEICGFAREMRPIDANIVFGIKGNDYHLYDIRTGSTLPKRRDEALRYIFEYRGLSVSRMLKIIRYRLKEKTGRD